MATTRLHKNLTPAGAPSLFSNLSVNGTPLEDVTTRAQRTKPNWPAYSSDICVETFALDFNVHSQYEVPQMVVLRGTLSCCCDVYCNYPGHNYSNGGALQTAASLQSTMSGTPLFTHPPGKDYVESAIDLNTLIPFMNDAKVRAADPTTRAELAAEIKAEADKVGLTADEIESQLGLVDVDTHGMLMGAGSAANVLSGADADITDYFWVQAFVLLYQRFVLNIYNKLTQDWPQRGTFKNSNFTSAV